VGGILGNRILLTAIAADATAQVLKALVCLIIEKRWCPERLFGSGGMPSSHSALVSALAVGVGIREGFASTLFAVAAVFALVVMYDATGVRRSAGRQAHVLNELILRLGHVLEEGFEPRALKTFLGHSYPQVLAGMILGIAAAWISLGG
jgi:hypothetical protein